MLGHFDTVWPVGQLDRMPLTRIGRADCTDRACST